MKDEMTLEEFNSKNGLRPAACSVLVAKFILVQTSFWRLDFGSLASYVEERNILQKGICKKYIHIWIYKQINQICFKRLVSLVALQFHLEMDN